MGFFWYLTAWLLFLLSVGGEGIKRRPKPSLPDMTRYTCFGDESVYFFGNVRNSSLAITASPPTVVYALETDDVHVLGVGAPVTAGSTFTEAGLLPVFYTSQNRLAALIGYQCSPHAQFVVYHAGIFVNASRAFNCVDHLRTEWGEARQVQQQFDPLMLSIRFDKMISNGNCCYVALRNEYRDGRVEKLRMDRYENQVTTLLFEGHVAKGVKHFNPGLKVLKWNSNVGHWLIQGPDFNDYCEDIACDLGPGGLSAYPPFVPFDLVQNFFDPSNDHVAVQQGACGLSGALLEARMSLRTFAKSQ